ncbi:MAG: O-methyltransferase [Bacteroidetes bacterium]|nr:O-methyltransferase [Bacteroidota bacterium]
MDFLPQDIENYALQHTSKESELLYRLNRETHQKILKPRMLSGHLQGRVLSMMSKMIQPEKILEIGTYTGYSALCLAEGLKEKGELHTIDVNEELKDFAQSFFDASEHKNQIHYHIGNALEIIPMLDGPFDIVFIDADKENYLTYFNLIFDKVKQGGYLIADNVLWSGKVVETVKANDTDTQKLMEFNDFVQNNPQIENVLLPVRDGLMVCRKK